MRYLTPAVLLVALAVTVQRGLHRKCWSFAVNLAVVSGGAFLMLVWPGTFYTRDFYGASRDLHAALKLLIALELGYYVFRAFPRALAVARAGSLIILAALAVAVAGAAPWLGWATWRLSRASFHAGTVWLFAGMAILVLWYNLPLDRWHATIIAGYTAYLVLATVLLGSEGIWRTYGALLDPVLAGWWAYSAWAFGRTPAVDSVHARRRLVGEGEARA